MSEPISQAQVEELLARMRRQERLSLYLRDRLAEESQLLMLALHQLALATDRRDPQAFMRRWVRQHRTLDVGEESPEET